MGVENLIKTYLKSRYVGGALNVYELPDYKEFLLLFATDMERNSDEYAPGRGEIITALNVFLLVGPLKAFSNHLVAYGAGIDEYLPQKNLYKNPELQKRASIVKKLEINPVDCIVFGFLVETAYQEYEKNNGLVLGRRLPEGLCNGAVIPDGPIFGSTIARAENICPKKLKTLSLAIYKDLYYFCFHKNIVLASAKLVFGKFLGVENFILADSIADSCCFYDVVTKQLWKNYYKLFERLTGFSLKRFQKEKMGIHS